jgi:ABC-type bacteriocin/lantibiotic exporter with double-glycine peptidase domain
VSREEVLARTVFTVDGDAYTWADVLAAAEAWGALAPATEDAGGSVEERATAFRRRRGLLSVDDTAAWFARWGITVPEWLASLGGPADPWVSAVTSGALERTAHRLAAGVVAHRALGGTGRPDAAAIDAAARRFADQTATPDRIAAAVAVNRLEWTALDLQPDDGAGFRIMLADAGDSLARLLVGAAAGDVVGPVTVDGRRRTIKVRARIEPDPADPSIAARARAEVAATALTREVASRVRWLEQVDDPSPAPADEAPDHDDAGDFARPPHRIRRFPTVLGIDETDCGAACLTAVCRHFGRAVSLPTVRDAVATALDGTSLAGLAAGAERLGLAARAVKASPSRLDTLPLPAICHWQGNHWVVLHDSDHRSVRVMDPLTGPRRILRPEWDKNWSGFACLVAPTPAMANVAEGQPPWRWLLPFFRPHRRPFAVAVALGLVAAGLEMLIPLAAGRIVDGAIAEGDRAQLHLLALGMLGVLLAAVTAGLVQRWVLARVAVRFDAATLDHITERLLALPATYFGSRRTGDIERRVAGMRQVRIYLVQQGVVGLTAAAQIFAAVVIMVALSPPLAATYLATVPLYAAAITYSRRRLRPVLASLEESFGAYHSRQIDAIRGIETVKARGAERTLQTVMRRQFNALADRVYRSDLAFMRYDAAVSLVTFLTLALVLWAGGLFVLGDNLSIGELVAFNGLVVLANGPIGTLLRLWDDVQYASVLLGRLDDVLAREPEQGEDHSHLKPVPALTGRVSIQHLTVTTEGPVPATILDDVSLEVEPGQTIALVGRSGAGKTTLVRGLAGLQPITSGRILYDGVDLEALDHRELRRRIGFVLQDDHLFDGTLAANIALGDEEVDMERVRWAARVADAAGFIERLPLGYDTRIGETGLRLSGGQAQRVTIARAVYRRPSVLILDEATSSLDAESERAVHQGIDELLQGRTAFVIAHRLSTVRDADHIVVLDGGRVVEQGTHDALMARRSLYWYLAGQQLDG